MRSRPWTGIGRRRGQVSHIALLGISLAVLIIVFLFLRWGRAEREARTIARAGIAAVGDVLIIPQTQITRSGAKLLNRWVQNGGGLLITHGSIRQVFPSIGTAHVTSNAAALPHSSES